MKKYYIAPTMDMIDFASEGLMQNPNIGFASGSGGVQTVSSAEQID